LTIPNGTTGSTSSASQTTAMPVVASTFDIQPYPFSHCTLVSANSDPVAVDELGAFLFTPGTWFLLAGGRMSLSCRESEEGDLINDPTSSMFISWLTVTSIGPVVAVCDPFQRNSAECTVRGPLPLATTWGGMKRTTPRGANGWRQPSVADHKTPAGTTPGCGSLRHLALS
jgi:hypothetical protein